MLLWSFRSIARLPVGMIRALASPLALAVWWLAGARRRITLRNLELCFPQWSPQRRREVARGHFRAFVVSLLERFVFWFGTPERIRALCAIEGLEHARAHEGRPLILLAPHFVGMDAGGMRYQMETAQVASMYAQQKSGTINRLMTEGRERYGARMLLRNEGMRGVVRVLREGVPFIFLPDMDLGARDAVFVPFFGVPAATVTSVARLARITDARVVPCVTRMTPDGYVVRFYPAWEDYPGDDIEAATARMNRFIEERVLEMPEQYLWSHKRFKTRPPGEPSPYI